MENEDLFQNEKLKEYIKLAEDEMAQYQRQLSIVEEELFKFKKGYSAPLIELTEEQQTFINTRPDYVKYADSVKQLQEKIVLIKELRDQKCTAELKKGRELIKKTLKEIHR